MTDHWEKIGELPIDSAEVLLIDPMYASSAADPDLGVRSETGVGDGLYPVYALKGNIPGWGERTKALYIDFMDEQVLALIFKTLSSFTSAPGGPSAP